MKKECKIEYSDVLYKILLFLFGLFLLAFYKWMIENGDNPSHLRLVESIFNSDGRINQKITYPLYHFVTRVVSFVCLNDIYAAGMCVLTVSNIVSAIIMRDILLYVCKKTAVWKKYIIDLISVLYLFFETVAGPLTDGRIYQRQCGPNPWHNPTITFVRPIGLIALYFFVKYMDEVECDEPNSKHLILFSFFSALSILSKPSFMMVFLPAMGVYVFLYWMRDFRGRFRVAMLMLLSVLPSVAIVLFQFLFYKLYNYSDGVTVASHIRFQLGGFAEFTPIEVVKVCIATFPVPIIALALYGKSIFESTYTRIAYTALVFGVVEMFLLTNGPTGDFSWGYDLSVGVATMVTLGVSTDIEHGRWRRIPLFITFAYQVIVGFYYVINMYNGGGHWV